MSSHYFISYSLLHYWLVPNLFIPVFPLHEGAIPEYFQSGIFTNMIRCCYGIWKYKFAQIKYNIILEYLSSCNHKEMTFHCISVILTFSITVYFTQDYFAFLLEIRE